MSYKILVIDDDQPMHLIADKILNEDYEIIHAYDAQEGIDILSKKPINLVLSDIYMPGLTGLEFLQVLKKDTLKKQIPVLIMTNLPSVEKEQQALDYGAADFINKTEIVRDREELARRVRMKLVTNVVVPELDENLLKKKNKLITNIMLAAKNSDFDVTIKDLCSDLADKLNLDYCAFWVIEDELPHLIYQQGKKTPGKYDFKGDLLAEETFRNLLDSRKPYLSNNVFGDGEGVMKGFSKENELPSEIGIPLFAVNERKLLMNEMEVPEDADMFGFLLLKRNQLFASEEYEMISRLLVQTGSILWRIFSKSSFSKQ